MLWTGTWNRVDWKLSEGSESSTPASRASRAISPSCWPMASAFSKDSSSHTLPSGSTFSMCRVVISPPTIAFR